MPALFCRPSTMWIGGSALVLVALPFLAPWSTSLLTVALAKGIAVLGIAVLLRAGQVSFGHAMYFAAGAYTVAFVQRTLGPIDVAFTLAAAILVATLLGIIIGSFVARYRYIFFGMLNLALSMVMFSVLEKFFHITGGSDGIRIERPTVFGFELERAPFELGLLWGTLALALVTAWGVSRYLASAPGQALQAIKTNETRLEYLGISAQRTLLAGYILSAALGGLSGGLVGIAQGLATPEFSYWIRSGELVFIAILGGAGHVVGAFAGSFLYETVRAYAAAAFSEVWQLGLGTIMLLVILFSPTGIVGMGVRIAEHLRRRAWKRS